MDKIFDLIPQMPKSLQPYIYPTALLVGVLYLFISKLPSILDSLGYFKASKIKRMEEALGSEYINDSYKKVLESEYSLLVFSSSMNISPDKEKIKKSLEIHEYIKGRCSIKDIFISIDYRSESFKNLNTEELKRLVKTLGGYGYLRELFEKVIYVLAVLACIYSIYFEYVNAPEVISSTSKLVNYIQYFSLAIGSIGTAIVIFQQNKRKSSTLKVLKAFIAMRNEQEASQDTSNF